MNREIAAFLRDVAAGEMGPALAERARTLLRPDPARKARRKAKAAPRLATKAERERIDAERHRRFVGAMMARDGYECQLCDEPRRIEALDPHHLELGPNKIKHEKLSNTLAAHRSCHEAAHRNEAAFVPKVKAWAAKHGYPLPNRRVYR